MIPTSDPGGFDSPSGSSPPGESAFQELRGQVLDAIQAKGSPDEVRLVRDGKAIYGLALERGAHPCLTIASASLDDMKPPQVVTVWGEQIHRSLWGLISFSVGLERDK